MANYVFYNNLNTKRMKKTLIAVSVILAMSSCSKQELIPTQEQHNASVKVSTHNQNWLVAYVVNIASIPSIQSINDSYEFYAELKDGSRVCCNVNEDNWQHLFHERVSIDLDEVGYTDLIEGFYVEVSGMRYKLDITEIY